MTIEEKGKAAILGHGAWCQVLGLICDFHMLAEDKDYSSANYQISILKPTGIRLSQQINAKIL